MLTDRIVARLRKIWLPKKQRTTDLQTGFAEETATIPAIWPPNSSRLRAVARDLPWQWLPSHVL